MPNRRPCVCCKNEKRSREICRVVCFCAAERSCTVRGERVLCCGPDFKRRRSSVHETHGFSL